MNEPIYEYVKGQGWVPGRNTPRKFPWENLNTRCLRCGFIAGYHTGASDPEHNWCPDSDTPGHDYKLPHETWL